MPASISRRDLLVAAGAAGAACACGCAGEGRPASAQGTVAAGPVDVGPLDAGAVRDLPGDGVTDRWARSAGFLLVRAGGRLYAYSAVCTHKHCIVKAAGTEVRCPCHGARYDLAGQVTRGPAEEPLRRLPIRLTDHGHIIVDPSRPLPPGHPDTDGAVVKLS